MDSPCPLTSIMVVYLVCFCMIILWCLLQMLCYIRYMRGVESDLDKEERENLLENHDD